MTDQSVLIRQLQGAVRRGDGSPEGRVDAPGGVVYERGDGPPWLYVKESAAGKTGWRLGAGSRWFSGGSAYQASIVADGTIRGGDFFLLQSGVEPDNGQVYEYVSAAAGYAYRLDLTGPTGAPGSKWYSGDATYQGSIATAGTIRPGDFFLLQSATEPSNGEVYEYTALGYVLRLDLTGPVGPQGPAGAAGSVPTVSALPDTPTSGQEVYYFNGSTLWHLKYDAGLTGPYKWWFVGGAPMHAENSTVSTQTLPADMGTYDLVANGANLTIPLSGNYNVGFGWVIRNTAATGTAVLTMHAAGVQVLTELVTTTPSVSGYCDAYTICGADGLAAGAALTQRATSNQGGVNAWESRGKRASLWPIRVG